MLTCRPAAGVHGQLRAVPQQVAHGRASERRWDGAVLGLPLRGNLRGKTVASRSGAPAGALRFPAIPSRTPGPLGGAGGAARRFGWAPFPQRPSCSQELGGVSATARGSRWRFGFGAVGLYGSCLRCKASGSISEHLIRLYSGNSPVAEKNQLPFFPCGEVLRNPLPAGSPETGLGWHLVYSD